MKFYKNKLRPFSTLSLLALFSLGACGHLDRSSVRASMTVPESVRVAERSIPYDASLPRYLLVLEPVRIAQDVQQFHSIERSSQDRRYAQTDLDKLRDHTHDDSSKSGTSGALLRAEIDTQQAGSPPPQLKAGVGIQQRESTHATHEGARDQLHKRFGSEQTQGTVDYRSTQSTASLSNRSVQISTQLASAFAQVKNFSLASGTESVLRGERLALPKARRGEQGPYIVRAILTEYEAQAEADSEGLRLGVYRRSESAVRGIVAFDVSVHDAASGRVIAAFPVRSSFSSAQLAQDAHVYKRKEFAQSTIDQALRLASYDAAQRLFDELRSRP